MKHVFTLSEIATACSEYVVRKYFPTSTTWDAKASIETVKMDSAKMVNADWKSDFSEGVIIGISVEVKPHDENQSE
jgi:hypothetical protein